MKALHFGFSATVLAVTAACALTGCGLGGDADLGDDQSNVGKSANKDDSNNGGSGGSAGSAGSPGTAGTAGSGGAAPGSEACGPTVCTEGEVCCNESCGICTPPGGACDMQFCEPDPGDCSGIAALCIVGTTWSVDACRCVPVEGTACGPTVCAAGEVCCNESCGICTPPGGACTEQFCGDPPPDDCSGAAALCLEGTVWSVDDCACVPGVACGPSVCKVGEVCCNESCGICTPPDGACTMQLCDPAPGDECVTDADCPPLQCFVAPCDTVACVNGTCTVVP